MEDIQAVDEAAQVLRGDDQDSVKHDKKKQQEWAAAADGFRNEYKSEAKVFYANAKARTTKLAYKGPSKLPNYDHTEQQQLKPFLQPGGYIWRVGGIGGCLSRYKELPASAFRDSNFDSQWLCAKAAPAYSWEQCLPLFGVDNGDCPVVGLFSS